MTCINKKLTMIIFLIISVLLLFGCSKNNSSEYELDIKDVISIINEQGQYSDINGYIFNTYKKNEHFEIYYNDSIKKNEKYAEEKLNELEDIYFDTLEFFDLKKEDMPVIKIYMYGGNIKNLHKAFEAELGEGYEDLNGKSLSPNSIYIFNDADSKYDFIECVFKNFAGNKFMPSWLLEGTVSYLNFFTDPYIEKYAEFAEYDTLNFKELNKDNKTSYEFSHSLVSCIAEKYGEQKLKELISSGGDITKILKIKDSEFLGIWKDYTVKNALENIHGFNDLDVVELIDKNGFYEDKGGFKFDRYLSSNHFQIYFNSKAYIDIEELMQNTMNYLESNYNKIMSIFNMKEEDMPIVNIYMYDKYSDFVNQRRALGRPVHIYYSGVAVNSNEIYISSIKNTDTDERFNSMVTALHEFIHTVHANKTGKKPIQRWLLEGIAMYYSQTYDCFGQGFYEKFIDEGLVEFSSLNDYSSDENSFTPYMYGYTMIEYIVKEYGQEKLNDVINEYGNIEKALGLTIDEFSEKWRLFIKEKLENR